MGGWWLGEAIHDLHRPPQTSTRLMAPRVNHLLRVEEIKIAVILVAMLVRIGGKCEVCSRLPGNASLAALAAVHP